MDARNVVAPATAAAGSVSIAVTVLIWTSGYGRRDTMWGGQVGTDHQQDAAVWLLAEPLGLALLVFVVIRWSSPSAGVVSGSLAATGSALWAQRFVADEPALEAAAASAAWLIPSLATGTVAWYLRWAAAERARAISMVRSEQRMRLAVDLHDYVAHDISEIVARAQAGTAVLPLADPRVAELLDQIEAAGLRALDSMDQTVHALGEDPVHATRGGIDDIDELVRRFSAAGEVAAVVEHRLAERRLAEHVDAKIGAEAYRAVVEALTNVRRHAVRASKVSVVLTEADGQLLVSITDDGDGRSGSATQTAGGLGLAAMTERVQRLGGSVDAGPRGPRGWQVTVAMPLSCRTERGATA